jgi:hypothetical protein
MKKQRGKRTQALFGARKNPNFLKKSNKFVQNTKPRSRLFLIPWRKKKKKQVMPIQDSKLVS